MVGAALVEAYKKANASGQPHSTAIIAAFTAAYLASNDIPDAPSSGGIRIPGKAVATLTNVTTWVLSLMTAAIQPSANDGAQGTITDQGYFGSLYQAFFGPSEITATAASVPPVAAAAPTAIAQSAVKTTESSVTAGATGAPSSVPAYQYQFGDYTRWLLAKAMGSGEAAPGAAGGAAPPAAAAVAVPV